ncbi:MAG: 1-acyl-sn-glycerol-3-phosphate acyltransferase [Phycisphaerales bacterium]|nr:MAG: 1-acyl-sn-glycerol-3-phosphate acyltransferase [Phycisphaerales bacterium]
MFRALVTFFVSALIVLLVSIPGLIIGLVYPARWVADWSSFLWSRAILWVSSVALLIEGSEHICRGPEPAFYVGNHQSALDIPMLVVALRGRVRFLAKKSLFRIPVFGWLLSLYSYVPIDRANPRKTLKSLERMLELVEQRSVSPVVFPEGTRSPDGRLLPFRKGAMKICQRAGLTIVPFAIHGSGAVHRTGEFRIRPGEIRVSFSEPIPADDVKAMSSSDLHDRVRASIEHTFRRLREKETAGGADVESSEVD